MFEPIDLSIDLCDQMDNRATKILKNDISSSIHSKTHDHDTEKTADDTAVTLPNPPDKAIARPEELKMFKIPVYVPPVRYQTEDDYDVKSC